MERGTGAPEARHSAAPCHQTQRDRHGKGRTGSTPGARGRPVCCTHGTTRASPWAPPQAHHKLDRCASDSNGGKSVVATLETKEKAGRGKGTGRTGHGKRGRWAAKGCRTGGDRGGLAGLAWHEGAPARLRGWARQRRGGRERTKRAHTALFAPTPPRLLSCRVAQARRRTQTHSLASTQGAAAEQRAPPSSVRATPRQPTPPRSSPARRRHLGQRGEVLLGQAGAGAGAGSATGGAATGGATAATALAAAATATALATALAAATAATALTTATAWWGARG